VSAAETRDADVDGVPPPRGDVELCLGLDVRLWIVVLVALSAALRLFGLGDQMLVGDELYTLWAIDQNALGDLPGSVGRFDHSIPISILYALAAHVTPVSEWMLRVPVVAAGVALPPLAFLAARRFVSPQAALLLALWLAVHPLFVFYGRFARAYGLCAPLLMAMIVWLDRWQIERRNRLLVQAACAGALAAWLHLLALMTAGLVFGAALLVAIIERRGAAAPTGSDTPRPAPPLPLVTAGLACLALVVVLYWPAAQGLEAHVFGGKIGDTPLSARHVIATLPLFAGLHGRGFGAAFVLLGLAGFVLLARRLGPRSLLLIVPALAQPILIAVLAPTKVSYALVLARYLVYVLPLWMAAICALTSEGLDRLFARFSGDDAAGGRARAAAAVALALALLIGGPWWTIYGQGSSFAHGNHYQVLAHLEGTHALFAWPPAQVARLHPSAVHEVYARMDADTPLVVEWWPSPDPHYVALARAQKIHRRPVKIIPYRVWSEAFDLAGEIRVPGDLASLPPGTWVVVHRPRQTGAGMRPLDEVLGPVRAALGPAELEDDELVAFRVPAPRIGTIPP